MKLAVQLVTWNGGNYLPDLFESLLSQTFKDWELLVLDNGSQDESLSSLRKYLEKFPNSKLVSEEKNIGFAPAHNKLFQMSDSKYVMLLNQDMKLESDLIERMVNVMDANEALASAAPRLMRMEKGVKTNIVDSLGIMIMNNRRVMDVCSGKNWEEISIGLKEKIFVFGVSGAMPIYRRNCLEGELFDKNFFAYQEDFDLAWRLQNYGHASAVVTNAVAYHERTGRGPQNKSAVAALVNKGSQSFIVRYHSYKNHLMTLLKNERWQNLTLDFPFILWYELRKMIYFILFDRKVLSGLKVVFSEKKRILDDRKRIFEKTKSSWKDIRKWVGVQYINRDYV